MTPQGARIDPLKTVPEVSLVKSNSEALSTTTSASLKSSSAPFFLRAEGVGKTRAQRTKDSNGKNSWFIGVSYGVLPLN